MALFHSPSKLILIIFIVLICNFAHSQPESEAVQTIKLHLIKASDLEKKVELYNDLAWEYSMSNYDSALIYTQKAIALSSTLDNNYWKAVSLEMMALLKEISGQIEQAAKLYMEVIDLREDMGGKGLETTYNNLGILFKSQENYQKALFYFRKSHVIELQNNNAEGIGGSLINISISLSHLGEMDSIYTLLNEALIIAKNNKLDYILSGAYLGLSNYYIQNNKLDSALYFSEQIISLYQSGMETESLAIAFQNISDIHIKNKQYKLALQNLEKVEIKLKKLHNLELYSKFYASKAEALAGLGFHNQSYNYLLKFISSKDSLINKETVTVLNSLEQKYETEKKERKIMELRLLGVENKNQRNIFILISGFVMLGIISLFFLLRSKSKTNAIISNSLSEKEVLLKEIHHRVKNNLQIIASLLSLQSRYISNKTAIQAINEGKNRVKSMALIHQKLYQKDNLTGIEMKGYVQNLVESLLTSYAIKNEQIDLKCDIHAIRLDVDTAIPLGLILNELVTNVLKYAFENSKGKVFIQLIKENDQLKLTVKDNGMGFTKTDKKQEEGYGTRLISSLSRKLKATVLVDSSAGTTYILTIKKFKLV